MESARKIDANGFLLVEGCPISSYGIFDYSAGQIGLDGDPNRIVKVFRPESAVSDPEAIESFKNVPFLIDHEMLSGFEGDDDTTAPEDYGMDGVLTSNVYYAAPWMRGDLKIYTRRAQAALDANKKDLSLGYSCEWDPTPGVWNGQAYEVMQITMRGNHIALVDEGRVPGARVLDGLIFDHLNFEVVRPSDKGNSTMKKTLSKAAKDNAVQQLQALIPALQQFLGQEAQEPEHQDADPNADPSMAAGDPAAADPAANADPAAADPAASADPSASAGGDVAALIKQVQAILTQLAAACGGSGNEGAGNGADEDTDPTAGEGEDLDPAVDPTVAADEEGAGEGNGHASPGPKAGANAMAGDAALGVFYRDLAAKTRLYDRVSKVVGTFDHAVMDASALAAYGVKKLGLKGVKKGTEAIALDMYLTGIERGSKNAAPAPAHVGDSAPALSKNLNAYLTGSK